MFAEMVMFIQLLGMTTLAAILPTIIVMCAIYLAYTYRVQIWWFIKGIMRAISYGLTCITDGKATADKRLLERK